MTSLLDIGPGEIDPFTEADRSEADQLLEEMEHTLDSIRSGELKLATSYARLGRQLLRVKERQFWLTWGFKSFGQYIDDLRGKIGRQRSQLYNVVSVAERLLPSVSESDLEKMGITRASELSKFAKYSGKKVSQELLDIALDPNKSVEDLHVAVLEGLNQKDEVKGTWWPEYGGFYCTPDERLELKQAAEAAKRIDPQIDPNMPEHCVRKEIVLRWAREFYGTYSGVLNG